MLRQHPQLLKVDQTVDLGLVAIKQEREVLLYDGEEWDEWRVGGSLELPVLGHVVERCHVAHKVLCVRVCVHVCVCVLCVCVCARTCVWVCQNACESDLFIMTHHQSIMCLQAFHTVFRSHVEN